jgi:hypothetical protein
MTFKKRKIRYHFIVDEWCRKMTEVEEHPKFLVKQNSLCGDRSTVDSSDIIYMFDDDEDGGKWIPSKPIMAKLFSTLHTK